MNQPERQILSQNVRLEGGILNVLKRLKRLKRKIVDKPPRAEPFRAIDALIHELEQRYPEIKKEQRP